MGRELKRVALDFDWPLHKVWQGFINPHDYHDDDSWPSVEAEELYENWEPEEPPTGEGYQLWETVSEGSPISPVFATKETFIAYLIGEGYSAIAAEKFVEVGWVPSMAIYNGRIYSNLETLNMKKDEE